MKGVNMKKFNLLPLLILLLLSALIFSACSDDKGTSGNGNVDLSSIMDTVVNHMETMMGSIMYGEGQFDDFTPPASPSQVPGVFGKLNGATSPMDTIYVTYENGWHIFVMDLDTSYADTTIQVTIADSVQFREGETIVQFPDANTDFLHLKFWLILIANAPPVSLNLEYNTDNEYTVLQSGDVEVNGNIDFLISADSADLGGSIDYDIDIDQLKLDDDDGCPYSGTLTATMTVSFSGPEAVLNGSWTMTLTFIDYNTWRIRLVSGDNILEETRDFDCGDFETDL
jgi:hypothetical protein